jgi:hypothetical protein
MSKTSVNFTKRPMVVLGQRGTVVYVDSAHFALKNGKPVEERTHQVNQLVRGAQWIGNLG